MKILKFKKQISDIQAYNYTIKTKTIYFINRIVNKSKIIMLDIDGYIENDTYLFKINGYYSFIRHRKARRKNKDY